MTAMASAAPQQPDPRHRIKVDRASFPLLLCQPAVVTQEWAMGGWDRGGCVAVWIQCHKPFSINNAKDYNYILV